MMASQTVTNVPPDVSTIKTMNEIAKILAMIYGILLIIIGVFTIVHVAGGFTTVNVWGIIPLIFGIVNLILYLQINKIDALVDQQKYMDAKNQTLVWMVIGFIFAGILVAIVLLISYSKYDGIIRAVPQNAQTPPPQQPPTI